MEDSTGTITVPPQARGQRLDAWLASALPDQSRSRWKSLIEDGLVTLDRRPLKPRYSLQGGEVLEWTVPAEIPLEPQPEDISLEILHEDEHLVVIDKPTGLVVHPAEGNPDGTLVNALLHHTGGRLASIGAPLRPGIVHRLDRDTSGCLVAAKTDLAHAHLVQQFAARSTRKLYLAVAQGTPSPPSGTVFTHIGRHPVHRQKMAAVEPPAGKPSITDYRVVSFHPEGTSALVLCHLHTGRTHQIRVHLQHLGHPILGDPIYAKPARQGWESRLMLHAWSLGFTHPASETWMQFEAPVPTAYQPWCAALDLPDLLANARSE